MSHIDAEVEALKAGTDCAALLERAADPWRLDRVESTPNARKYRRGPGEILIVSHQGRGWWDPQSDQRGDAFSLVQRLDPNLNFGEARKMLRAFAGVPASNLEFERTRRCCVTALPDARWRQRPPIKPGSPTWHYLVRARALPATVLRAASLADVVRQGYCGSAWFAHRDRAGTVCHVDSRGPAFKGSLRGGNKTLFLFAPGAHPKARLVLAEAPIDALSLAALEDMQSDTLYAATAGGMGPETIAVIRQMLAGPDAPDILVSASDANCPGDRYAERHRGLAEAHQVRFERLRPPEPHEDWNDVLKARPGE